MFSVIVNRSVGVGVCVAHPGNYNRHSAEQLAMLRQSLRKFGQVRSIVVQDDGAGGYVVVAGHGVWEAARLEGLETLRADVIPATWPAATVLAYLAADNELARGGDPDQAQLAALVQGLEEEDHLLAQLAAGGDDRLDELLVLAAEGEGEAEAAAPAPKVDLAAEMQAKWQVRPGDVWRAGPHYVVCGDCRDPAVWRRLFETAGVEEARLVFTSPPYAEQRKAEYGGVPAAEYVDWWEALQANVRAHLSPTGSFCVNIKPHVEDGERSLYVMELVLAMKQRWGWCYIDEIVWEKPGFPGYFTNRLKNDFEPVHLFAAEGPVDVYLDVLPDGEAVAEVTGSPFLWTAGSVHQFAVRSRITFHPKRGGHVSDMVRVHVPGRHGRNPQTGNIDVAGERNCKRGVARPGNVLHLAGNVEALPHPAMFPVELPAFFIVVFTEPDDVVLDPFLGAGSTIVAAEQERRQGLGIEVHPESVAVTLERLADLGLQPLRVVEGEADGGGADAAGGGTSGVF